MAGEYKSEDVWIKRGCSLIFEAPEGGDEWRMRNTAQGLVIETGGKPVLRLKPDKVLIRSDLGVDGQIGREFDCHKFVGEWEVIAGDAPEKKDFAIIELVEGDRFKLTYRRKDKTSSDFEYFLKFNARTGTLDRDLNKSADHPDRCISFWDGRARGGDEKHRIFAMRKGREKEERKYDSADLKNYFLPWELEEDGLAIAGDPDNGTWGAQEG